MKYLHATLTRPVVYYTTAGILISKYLLFFEINAHLSFNNARRRSMVEGLVSEDFLCVTLRRLEHAAMSRQAYGHLRTR